MSFVERNKAWILPLLAVGVAGVVYLNLKTLSGPAPAPGAVAAPPADGSGSAPVPGPSTAQDSSTATQNPDSSDLTLWEDLKPLSVVPPGLAQTDELQSQATEVLGAKILHPPPSSPPSFPVPPDPGTSLPKARESSGDVPAAIVPDPDFIIENPEGRQVWFSGEGYRVHQKLDGSPLQVERIGKTRVLLHGPTGPVIRSTHPTIHSEAP